MLWKGVQRESTTVGGELCRTWNRPLKLAVNVRTSGGTGRGVWAEHDKVWRFSSYLKVVHRCRTTSPFHAREEAILRHLYKKKTILRNEGLLEKFGKFLCSQQGFNRKELVLEEIILGRSSHLVGFLKDFTREKHEPCPGRSYSMHEKLWGALGKVWVGREARNKEVSGRWHQHKRCTTTKKILFLWCWSKRMIILLQGVIVCILN